MKSTASDQPCALRVTFRQVARRADTSTDRSETSIGSLMACCDVARFGNGISAWRYLAISVAVAAGTCLMFPGCSPNTAAESGDLSAAAVSSLQPIATNPPNTETSDVVDEFSGASNPSSASDETLEQSLEKTDTLSSRSSTESPGSASVTSPTTSQAAVAPATPYSPERKDFLPAFERDTVNQQNQTFDEYFGWVEAFYAGNFVEPGWRRRSDKLLEQHAQTLLSSEATAELMSKLEELGKLIAAEWAKHRDCGKITNSHLLAFGQRLQEVDTAGELSEELDQIIAEVESCLVE